QPQVVDDTAGNLVLDGENVRQLAVKFARPQGQVVPHPNHLGIDTQLLAGALDRTLEDVIDLKLPSHLVQIPRLPFEGKGGGLRAHRQPVHDGQVADNLAGEAVGNIV